MHAQPFPVDPAIPARLAALTPLQAQIRADALAPIADPAHLRAHGRRISADHAAKVVARHGLSGVEELMLLLLPDAAMVARPPISGFTVGTVGREAVSGAITLGGNIEFPTAHFGHAIHGEGFVTTRAFLRGEALSHIALTAAMPCGHCRQFLSEFMAAPNLRLIDPAGHRMSLNDVLPGAFTPADLGTPGANPAAQLQSVALADPSQAPAPVAELLITAANRGHVPYSNCPASLVLEMADGGLVWGTGIESCAYNPTITPAQAAVVMLLDHGMAYGDIRRGWFARRAGAAVDLSLATQELLGRLAPNAPLTMMDLN
ncbi:cytidine deaminase [Ketogulonicigenium robustum]|uniref:Cytidine deaminase n=1 Tax=Ketogulonicigenium robustum TaxID=92947 RepID=A0A1W6NYS7_9RHOB|nr:cytidine deaminase [Ketogulonicigenium robustum]ARO14177.1 cytidine deaminase [Ketogulonicigenium robustum]